MVNLEFPVAARNGVWLIAMRDSLNEVLGLAPGTSICRCWEPLPMRMTFWNTSDYLLLKQAKGYASPCSSQPLASNRKCISFSNPSLTKKRNPSKTAINIQRVSSSVGKKLMSLGLKFNIPWLFYSRTGLGSVCCMWESARWPGRRLPHPICHPSHF